MKKALAVLITAALVVTCGFSGNNKPVTLEKNYFTNEHRAPIDRDTVVDKLVQDGKLSSNATQDEITKALKNFIGNATYKNQANKYDKMRDTINKKKIEEGFKAAELKGNKLGQSKKNNLEKPESIEFGQPAKTVKVLVLLGDFADYKHNNIEKPDVSRTYWTSDFTKEHYQELLFGDGYYTTPEGTKSPTFKQYFKEQSNGNLNVEGEVFGWYTAPEDAKYYGEDNENSHNIHAKDFTYHMAIEAVKAGVDLSEYDIEDPYDLDADGDVNEPDGIVDHLMIIHAGMGQEAGGGVLGDDSIWSHSSSVSSGPVSVPGSDVAIYTYTTEAENGAVGLFAHEFVHDLGMPDDYDTIYSADGDIVENWSLMAGGSWAGAPGGSMPTGINPYHRILLGGIHGGDWINWEYADFNELESGKMILDTATMNTGNNQALVISLPEESNILTLNKPSQGSWEFFGGKGAEIDNNMTLKVDLTGKSSAALAYDIWYDIEENWDAGFIQVSEDGVNFKSISTPLTVDDFNNPDGYPSILNSLPAYTGNSEGWITENIDLSSYANKEIFVRFRYATDWGTENTGMFVDDIKVTADGTVIASEDAENGMGAFVSEGFDTSNGNINNKHYYVAEWRSHLGVDEGLKYSGRARIEYNQGLALWYVNKNYSDNWAGVHPGYGQVGIVDAGQFVYLNSGLGNGNESGSRAGYMPFVQLHDAAFSLDKAEDMDLSVYSWAKTTNLKGKQANPLFDDSNAYFNVKSPYSGLKLPKVGLKIRVTGNASDYSRGEILISK